jgi:hypothetical protein
MLALIPGCVNNVTPSVKTLAGKTVSARPEKWTASDRWSELALLRYLLARAAELSRKIFQFRQAAQIAVSA